MDQFLKKILDNLGKAKHYLIAANFLLVFFLILLTNLGVLPMKLGDFIFFSLVYLIFALYRPGWSFLLFIGTIALENINLSPESLGISIRPYQIIGGLTIFSLFFRYFTKRLNFNFVKLKWFDYAAGVFVFSGFISALVAGNKGLALGQSVILISFAALYWLTRNYVQTFNDLKRIAPFFLGSGGIIVFYGIWQNIRFMKGLNAFETMPGRPNATFTEADWLGIYLVLLLSAIYAIIYFCHHESNEKSLENFKVQSLKFKMTVQNSKLFLSYLSLIPIFIILILTVSRSAWLGAGFVTLVFLKAIFTNFSFRFRDWNGKELLKQLSFVAGAVIISLGIVYVFHLTNFQLFNRAGSTGTGLQKITIACKEEIEIPEKINDVSELGKYDCRHINLEDIEKEKNEGNLVKEIYRNDPNINIRSDIYKKSIDQIKAHPLTGIGWGNIGNILGKDNRGAGLNSSNIFLEVWLGSGILGFLAFLTIWVYVFVKSVLYCIREDSESKIIGLVIVLGLFGFLIPNLFNAGVYLGIFWIFIGIASSLLSRKTTQ